MAHRRLLVSGSSHLHKNNILPMLAIVSQSRGDVSHPVCRQVPIPKQFRLWICQISFRQIERGELVLGNTVMPGDALH